MKSPEISFLFVFLLVAYIVSEGQTLHLKGSFKNEDFYKFLVKFGFQRIDSIDEENSAGYIYGNITAKSLKGYEYDMYLVVVERSYFKKFYSLREDSNLPERCKHMFSDIDTIAWDAYCAKHGKEDFLRRIPCKKGTICLEELQTPSLVIPSYQFTFHVSSSQERFWYISLVACHRPRSLKQPCHWSYNSSVELEVDYDIWFVNGHPDSKHLNPFEHQFSFEMHDVLEIYLAFFLLNLFLLAVQLLVFRKTKHLLIQLITVVIILEVLGIFFNLLHISIFAVNGEGVIGFQIFGNFLDLCAQSTVMLEIFFIAKGWTISTNGLSRKVILYTTWIIYTIIYIVLFSVNLVAVDPILDNDEWQTTPGYCIIVFRVIIMAYFLYELQNTISVEESTLKRKFYTRVGAGFLVWFIYLPILALVSPKIAALWRFKTMLSIQSGADFALLAILLHLFWPSESIQYFNIPTEQSSDSTRLVSEVDEESSEDELYERQASLHLNTYKSKDTSYTNGMSLQGPNGNSSNGSSRLQEASF